MQPPKSPAPLRDRVGRTARAAAGIFLAALALRCWGLSHGLPAAVHPDEQVLVQRALKMGGGDLNPHFFYYPSLFFYVSFALDGAYFVAGRLTGAFPSVQAFAERYVLDPTWFYLLPRLASAVADALTAVFLLLLGTRLFSWRAGGVAALLWVFFPVALDQSQLAKPDALMVCLTAAAAAVLAGGRPGWGGFLWGLAASTKYNAGFLAPAFGLWALAGPAGSGGRRWKDVFALGAAAAAGFFAGSPFIIPDHAEALRQLRDLSGMMGSGAGAPPGAAAGWAYYAGALFAPCGAFILGPAAAWALAREAPARSRAALFCGGVVLLVLAMQGGKPVYGAHYLLVAFPFWFLLAARGVETAWSRLADRHRSAAWAGAVVLALPFAVGSAQHLWRLGHRDTRLLAKTWIESHVPAGDTLLVDASGPRLWMTREQLQALCDHAAELGHIKKDLFALMLRAHPGGGYRLLQADQAYVVGEKNLIAYGRQVQDLAPINEGLAGLRSRGVRWVVQAERPYDSPEARALYPRHAAFSEELAAQGRVAARFPSGPWLRPGPEVVIYEI